MPFVVLNLVGQGVSGNPGTGTITLGAALPQRQALAATVDGVTVNGNTVDILLTEGSSVSIEKDCLYTAASNTLTRGVVETSTTGERLSLTSAATVQVVVAASRAAGWASGVLRQLAITDRATTPTPEPGEIWAWSTTGSRPAFWDGAAWNLVERPARNITLSANRTLSASDANVTFDTVSTSRAITVPFGLPDSFGGVIVFGPCTWAASGGVTITDRRATGVSYAITALTMRTTNVYELIGVGA